MYSYRAKVLNVHDGDTVRLLIDLGFRIAYEADVRLLELWAPELNTPEGKVSQQALAKLIPPGTEVFVNTYKKKSFDRWLGYVFPINPGGTAGISVSTTMKEMGYATNPPPEFKVPKE